MNELIVNLIDLKIGNDARLCGNISIESVRVRPGVRGPVASQIVEQRTNHRLRRERHSRQRSGHQILRKIKLLQTK